METNYYFTWHKGFKKVDTMGTLWDIPDGWEISFRYSTFIHSMSFKTFKNGVEKGQFPINFTKEDCLKILEENKDKL